ncbi:PAS domain S-box protein [Halobacterium bonnevillei]|uniref:histidine kinase n=2 Tax=Halobacterium bonnevillei TaxID=2692200 RepID=A0A6B0SN34_9EURY|nr:PAS domain S-box protein [Halobacterium bonnevillei]MXR21101.1 PAS domain S-box protein [Halobacterium bonnevillei]
MFRALADVVDGCVFAADGSGRVTAVNDEFVDRTGHDRTDVLGVRATRLFDEGADRIEDRLHASEQSSGAVSSSATLTTPAGGRVSGELRLRHVDPQAEDGGVVGVLERTADSDGLSLEQRRQTLEALHAAAVGPDESIEERIEAVLAVVHDVVGTDFATLSMVREDRYVFEAVRSPSDVDLDPGTVVDPESLPVCSTVVETGEPMALRDVSAEAPELADPEWGIETYLGAPVVVDGEVYGTFCFYGTEPSDEPFTEWERTLVELAAAWVSDELERRADRVELEERSEAIEASRRRYETLVENLPNGAVALVNDDLRYTTIGGTPVVENSDSTDAFEGKRVKEAVTDEFADVLEPKYRAALDGESSTFAYDSGETVSRIHTVPVYDDDGNVLAAMGMSQDITEQRERERRLEKYETIVETVNDGIYVVDEDGCYDTVNDAFTDLTGYDRRELLGEHASLVVDEETLERALEVRERADDTEGPPSMETIIETAAGETVPVEVTFSSLETRDGNQMRVGVVRDITERRERERQLAALIDNVPGMVYRCRNERGWPMAFVSDGCRELTGYDSETLESGAVSYGEDVVVDEDQADLWEAVQRGLERDGSFLVSYRVETPDGETRWVRERGHGIYDDDGNVTELEGVIIDITERKRLEAELEEILGRVTDAFYALDDEFRFTHVNERAEELLGASETELLGEQVWDEFPAAADIDDIWDAFHDAMETQEPQSFERYYDPLDFWIEATVHPSETGVSVYFRDVTERHEKRKQLEQSEQRYRALAENFPDGEVGLFDDSLEYTAVGGELVDEIGVETDERVGQSVDEIYPAEIAAQIEPYFRSALAGEQSSFEMSYRGRHIRAKTLPIRDGDGEVEAGMLVAQDVTERVENRRKLEESEQRYRSLVENLPNGGVGVFDEHLEYTLVDGTMWDDIDVDAADVEGRTIWEALPEETAADVEPVFRDALAGETDSVVSTLDGRIYRVWATPLRDTDGEITGGQSIALDVTEQQEREQRLERTLDLLEKTERIADVGGWEIDPETEDVFWSDHLFELLGVDYDEEPPLDEALDVYHEEDRHIVEDAVGAAMASGDPFDVEVRFRGPDGEIRWLRVEGAPETRDGDVVAVRGAAQDVTEREQRRRDLQRRADQQQVVADLGRAALETDDIDELMAVTARRVADVLDTDYCKILDLDAGEGELLLRQGVGWDDGVVGAATVDADANSQAGYTLLSEEPVVVDELDEEDRFSGPALLTDHDVTSGISTVIGSADDPWGILGTHDTARREFSAEDVNFVQSVANVLADAIERNEYNAEREALLTELEASNERLEQFAYAASHDLQEPLRMVSSYLSLIERRYGDKLDEDGREFIEYAVDGADRMQEMIDALLAYSRVETEGEQFEPVELDSVFEDLCQDFQLRIRESDATVTAESLPTVHGDEDQLRQVLGNLLSNAIEYSGDSPPTVEVSGRRADGEWVVAVSDDGIGIDPEHADDIFEVFQRLHSHDEHAGTGVGLALTQRIVERHGGDIWVESEPGEGATFYFTVPDVKTND